MILVFLHQARLAFTSDYLANLSLFIKQSPDLEVKVT